VSPQKISNLVEQKQN